jgi:AraC-like DNA-binding protein
MSALEIVLRLLGLALLATLAVLVLRARRRGLASRIGAALCASVGAFLLTSMPNADDLLGLAVYPLTAVCATHPVWFWLFCAAVFGDLRTLSRRHVVALAAMASAGVLEQSLTGTTWATAAPVTYRTLGVAYGAASLCFALLGPLAVLRGRRADLDERRRRVRTWFVPVVGAYLAIIIVTQAYVVVAGTSTPQPLVLANLALIDALAALGIASFVQIRVVDWTAPMQAEPRRELLSRVESGVLDRLLQRIDCERLYARENLTIAGLAGLLGTQEHVLRRVINGGLGFRNFNDFLHAHRLREAAARLRDPAQGRVPVLTIALEAGYGSIGPFNRAFRERFGCTPTQYRRVPPAERESKEEFTHRCPAP